VGKGGDYTQIHTTVQQDEGVGEEGQEEADGGFARARMCGVITLRGNATEKSWNIQGVGGGCLGNEPWGSAIAEGKSGVVLLWGKEGDGLRLWSAGEDMGG